jgi:hypothetical protein
MSKQFTLSFIIAILINACSSNTLPKEPQIEDNQQQLTKSELIANCIEDYELTDLEVEMSSDMDRYELIDFRVKQASEYCEAKYN